MVRQEVPLHTYAPHGCVTCGHWPPPLQPLASVAVPLAQDAASQPSVSSGKLHLVRSTPSHLLPHVVPAPTPPHAERDPTGVPVVAMQLPEVLQYSHCPPHALSQQTPSTQVSPLTHWLVAVHVPPAAFFVAHVFGLPVGVQ